MGNAIIEIDTTTGELVGKIVNDNASAGQVAAIMDTEFKSYSVHPFTKPVQSVPTPTTSEKEYVKIMSMEIFQPEYVVEMEISEEAMGIVESLS